MSISAKQIVRGILGKKGVKFGKIFFADREMVKSQHNPYFDFLRGLAILMVVGIHTYNPGHLLYGGLSEVMQLIIRNLLNCAVPLFLAISGYFMGQKDLSTLRKCKKFWSKQIPTVYVPCLIFSLPWLVLSIKSGTYKWGGVVSDVLNYLLCGESIYYFILLIIECYLLAPLLIKHNNTSVLIVIIAISILSAAAFEYVRFSNGIELPLIVYGSFPPLLIFFYLGIYLTRHSRDYSLWLPLGLIIIGIILGLLHMDYVQDTFGVSAPGQKTSLYVFDIGCILLCMSRKSEMAFSDNSFTRKIIYIGEISFGIYLTHMYLVFIADRFLPSMRENWIGLWSLSIVLTIGIIEICKKISPALSRRYLGYR